jgi:hypothetical protein
MTPSSPLHVTCGGCGRSNRPSAMFCIGCAGRLPAFVATRPSALETSRAPRLRPALPIRSDAPGHVLPAETLWFWLRLGLPLLVMMIGFMGWYLYITHQAAGSLPAVTPAVPAPAPASIPIAPSAAPASSAAATEIPRPTRSDASVEAVAKFYRALSAADGAAAAALVIPAKRGRGPFREEKMSSFYGSFREPLALRSIRAVDENVVEAKYRYRATRTPCEGVAIVETESVHQQTLIRSIRANC